MLSLRTLICQAYLAQYPTEVQTNPLEEPFFDSFGFLGSSQSFQYRNSNRSLRGKKKKSLCLIILMTDVGEKRMTWNKKEMESRRQRGDYRR